MSRKQLGYAVKALHFIVIIVFATNLYRER